MNISDLLGAQISKLKPVADNVLVNPTAAASKNVDEMAARLPNIQANVKKDTGSVSI